MLKKLLATVALVGALVAPTAASAANTTTLPLTDPLVGHWCEVKDKASHAGEFFKRGEWNCDGNLAIRQDGYDRYLFGIINCTFSKIKRLPNKDGYLVWVDCLNEVGIDSHDNMELRIVGDMLRFRTVEVSPSDPSCGVVTESMPDGFLNLRVGPGTKYPVKAKLLTGDFLKANDQSENGGWFRVKVVRLNISGWVSWRYFRFIDCSEISEKTSSNPAAPYDTTTPSHRAVAEGLLNGVATPAKTDAATCAIAIPPEGDVLAMRAQPRAKYRPLTTFDYGDLMWLGPQPKEDAVGPWSPRAGSVEGVPS
jgi:hypothetical protein